MDISAGTHVKMRTTVSAAITCICSMCTQHYHALQTNQMGSDDGKQVTYCVLLALLGVNEQ